MTILSRVFGNEADSNADSIAVFGGGLSAIFTAYQLKEKSRLAGKKLDVFLGAKEINTPCSAGNHTLRFIEGMFEGARLDMGRLSSLLKSGLADLRDTIDREKIDCRLQIGYEVKSERSEELEKIVSYMTENGMFSPEEITSNAGTQRLLFPGYPHSVAVDSQGQVNMPELLLGILDKIRDMDGEASIGTEYISHQRTTDGKYLIHTNNGDITTTLKPLIATGAEHQNSLKDLPVKTDVSYTMAFVMGPLAQHDARAIAKDGAMAFCTSELEGDFIWGGIDQNNYFTLGCGDIYNPTQQDRDVLELDIRKMIDSKFPGFLEKYEPKITFGPMLVTPNKMPIVGRLNNYDLIGGWAGMGIVAGWTAASAYADWVVNQDDAKLAFFETLQPGFSQSLQHFSAPGRGCNAG